MRQRFPFWRTTLPAISPITLGFIWRGMSIGTPLILFVVYKATTAWILGDLAKKTGAATA